MKKSLHEIVQRTCGRGTTDLFWRSKRNAANDTYFNNKRRAA